MIEKQYIDARELIRDSFVLAQQVFDSGFFPESLLALWRGGSTVGIVLHEFFRFKGLELQHAPVKVESYTGIGQRRLPRIADLEPLLAGLTPNARVLVVDDIFDTGHTMRAVCERLRSKTSQVKVATLYLKKRQPADESGPDYFVHQTDKWVVFPHELLDLSADELRAKDPFVHGLLYAKTVPRP